MAGRIVQRALAALHAGCDMVMVCNKPHSADELLAGLHWEMPATSMARLAHMRGRPHPDTLVQLHEQPEFVKAVHEVASIGSEPVSCRLTRQMRLRASLLAAVMLLALVAACNKTSSPPLMFGANIWPGYEPVFLARELGYFSGENLRIAEYRNASEVKQAFLRHELQLAAARSKMGYCLAVIFPT